MANNSVALGRHDGPDFFADDDPLAELARIGGYDERPSPRVQSGEQPRRDPVFNLEDELLREFERYDSPRLDPVGDLGVEPHASVALSPATQSQPVIAPLSAPVVTREQFVDADPFADPEPHVSAAPAAALRVAAEALAMPAGFLSSDAYDSMSLDADNLRGASDGNRRAPIEPGFDAGAFDLDLISELENSLAPAPVVSAGSRPSSRPPAKAYEPGFRMPLANFNRAPEPLREPRSAVLQPVEPVLTAAPASVWEADFAVAPPEAAKVVPDLAPTPVREAIENARFSPLDEPVYDVDHYSRGADHTLSVHTAPISQSVFEAPIVHDAPHFDDKPVFDEVPVAVAPARVEARQKAEAVPVPAPLVARAEPAAPVIPADFDVDMDFDIALDDLDLDLSDLMADEPGAFAPVAPVKANAVPVEPVRAAAPMPVQMPAPAPAAASLAPVVPAFLANSRSAQTLPVEPRTEASAPAPAEAATMPEDIVFDDADMFDPALLSDTEDMPEAVPDLNVPELPVHEPEKPRATHSDYDLDLDAELASFLETTNAEARAAAAPLSRVQPKTFAVAGSSASAVMAQPSDGLDEFERALEEDFRRSLSAPIPGRTRLDEDDRAFEPYEEPVTRRRAAAYVLPLSIAGFLLVAGVSGYAWFAGDGGRLGGDGAPVVIAADTDPVKMVPEHPGGKTVPNQDKAVYDRVAGGALHDPKQSSLISSDEQPVDVVQKTLVPEGFSLDGETEEMPAAVSEEARLSPGEAAPAAAPADPDQLAVMPRKVKTMIVRADGTLVEQVSDAPATTARTAKVPAAPALAEPTQTASTITPAAPVAAPVVAAAAPAPAATVSAGTAAPGTPVPTARPSAQPVKVVAAVSEQGNVRTPATPAPAQTAPVATASVPPAAAAPATASAGPGGYYIQVASLPSEADAQKSYRNLSSKFGSVIGGRGVDIAKAEIAGKGTFYRVRIPAGSKDEAAALCERLRAAGGTCLIAR
ncbi:SPOR domain-containing protein [Rhizobium sp. FY34]|uniref:SPOR domain-containing protein n=1 Tax=Rhizobium sp. FY34 TaxID=2562309 RepID=UPI0010BF8CF0|nr:SPOR domain-containing protein [Rhizobium sp. FY34]